MPCDLLLTKKKWVRCTMEHGGTETHFIHLTVSTLGPVDWSVSLTLSPWPRPGLHVLLISAACLTSVF
jgi:hypothetical protein